MQLTVLFLGSQGVIYAESSIETGIPKALVPSIPSLILSFKTHCVLV